MAKANTSWTVHPHEPLARLADNLWCVRGSLPGMPLKRNMVIVKLADGSLALHNPIAVDDATIAAIEGWGPVRYLLIPNGLHRLDARVFKERYPQADVLCPRGSRKKVEEVVAVDGAYEDLPADPGLEARRLDGVGEQEGALIVHSSGGEATVVVTDAIFNMPHVGGLLGLILRYVTASTGGPRVSRVAKMALVKDKAALRADFERLAETPGLRRLIVAHNDMVEGDAAGALRAAAATL